MTNFSDYAQYYDLFYQDKNYASEAQYVERLIGENSVRTSCILDIGSGTGRHAIHLAEAGFDVHGVDMSAAMVDKAEERLAGLDPDVMKRLRFSHADLRKLALDDRYDAIVALFHVMSYQVSNRDVDQALKAVRAHCDTGGLFIFDCWYGPAVLRANPELRVKTFEQGQLKVTRIAEPEHIHEDNLVIVNYTIQVQDRETGSCQEFHEAHKMRYFFLPELRQLLAQSGFSIMTTYEWMTFSDPSSDSWNVCIVARAE